MAVEAKRGCGYRKVGGIYMMGGKLAAPCCLLPMQLDVCPVCSGGIKQTRGWTWIEPAKLFDLEAAPCIDWHSSERTCSIPYLEGRHGLLWIGKQHYKSTLEFTHEAATQGISRRLKSVPKGLELGKTRVFVAHPEAMVAEMKNHEGEMEQRKVPGVFSVFIPTSLEILVKQSELTDDKREELEKRGLTPVAVPDDDADHCPQAA